MARARKAAPTGPPATTPPRATTAADPSPMTSAIPADPRVAAFQSASLVALCRTMNGSLARALDVMSAMV